MHTWDELVAVGGDEALVRQYLDENQREAEQQMGVVHLDGVRWYEAPLPRRWHRCRAQTRGLGVERCPCGAIRPTGAHWWIERNSRRRGWAP